jgi:hypothetical protein
MISGSEPENCGLFFVGNLQVRGKQTTAKQTVLSRVDKCRTRGRGGALILLFARAATSL